MVQIGPRFLSTVFGHLHNGLSALDNAGADLIRIDVMD